MVRIPVTFDRPVAVTQTGIAGPTQFRVNGAFDGGIATFVDVDGFGSGGYSYRILAIYILTSGGLAIGMVQAELRYPSSPWPTDTVYQSICVLPAAGSSETVWAFGEPGPPSTGPIAGAYYYQHNFPDFWFTDALTLRLSWSADRAGFWSVLYEKVKP
jgi:hypothetical protein